MYVFDESSMKPRLGVNLTQPIGDNYRDNYHKHFLYVHGNTVHGNKFSSFDTYFTGIKFGKSVEHVPMAMMENEAFAVMHCLLCAIQLGILITLESGINSLLSME